jgi:hypothetical protein
MQVAQLALILGNPVRSVDVRHGRQPGQFRLQRSQYPKECSCRSWLAGGRDQRLCCVDGGSQLVDGGSELWALSYKFSNFSPTKQAEPILQDCEAEFHFFLIDPAIRYSVACYTLLQPRQLSHGLAGKPGTIVP